MEAKINEIFSSIQGEGPYIGYKQLFIRFCGCNLGCKYCDTEFANGKFYSSSDLYKIVQNYIPLIHSVSLTGGEPLLCADFLAEFLPNVYKKTKIYLETNATLADEFERIKNYIDIVSADIKLPSSTGNDSLKEHEKFLSKCKNIITFAKIVFDESILEEEIKFCSELANKYEIPLILQPKTVGEKVSVSSDFCNEILNKFVNLHDDTRLIPQVHKFLNVR